MKLIKLKTQIRRLARNTQKPEDEHLYKKLNNLVSKQVHKDREEFWYQKTRKKILLKVGLLQEQTELNTL